MKVWQQNISGGGTAIWSVVECCPSSCMSWGNLHIFLHPKTASPPGRLTALASPLLQWLGQNEDFGLTWTLFWSPVLTTKAFFLLTEQDSYFVFTAVQGLVGQELQKSCRRAGQLILHKAALSPGERIFSFRRAQVLHTPRRRSPSRELQNMGRFLKRFFKIRRWFSTLSTIPLSHTLGGQQVPAIWWVH